MSGFISHSDLRKYFRNIVLPTIEIKGIIKESLKGIPMDSVLDFGAGTLFWSDWFVEEFKCNVYAVDTYYKNINLQKKNNIFTYSDLDECLNSHNNYSVVWACDVLHHLKDDEGELFLQKIVNNTGVVIIKDIDANHLFGNFMNKLHDKIINHEKVGNVSPIRISESLERNKFKTMYYYIPKLWYPHFLIIGIKDCKNKKNGT
jgi:2-polyprenyl-3-methyl-5-hydroxy-6-metoxy-1,4-benzoquinol methylase